MAEELARSALLGGLLRPSGRPGEPGVKVVERAGLTILGIAALKSNPRLAEDFSAATGIDLPPPLRCATAGPFTVLSTAPGAWLVLSEEGQGARFGRFAALAAVTDQSHGLAVLRLSGPRARDVLQKGLPIDLDPAAFAAGHAAATVCAHVGVTVWRPGMEESYDLAFARSFAASLWHGLEEAGREFGIGVDA